MATFTLTLDATYNTWQWLDSTGSAVSSGLVDSLGQGQFACTGTFSAFAVSAVTGCTVSGTASPYTVTIGTDSSGILSGSVTNAAGQATVKFTLQKSTGDE